MKILKKSLYQKGDIYILLFFAYLYAIQGILAVILSRGVSREDVDSAFLEFHNELVVLKGIYVSKIVTEMSEMERESIIQEMALDQSGMQAVQNTTEASKGDEVPCCGGDLGNLENTTAPTLPRIATVEDVVKFSKLEERIGKRELMKIRGMDEMAKQVMSTMNDEEEEIFNEIRDNVYNNLFEKMNAAIQESKENGKDIVIAEDRHLFLHDLFMLNAELIASKQIYVKRRMEAAEPIIVSPKRE